MGKATATKAKSTSAATDTTTTVEPGGTVEVDGYAIPADLIALQRDFFATHARCQALAAELPSATDIVTFDTEVDDARHADFSTARAERLCLVESLQSHPWWATTDNRFNAQRALYKTARD